MTLENIREALPDYAKDIRLNLGSVLTPQGAPGLSDQQSWSIAVAAALASRQMPFARQIEQLASAYLAPTDITGAKAAAAIMGMNNIYYRFVHLVEDSEYQTLPARLRMNGPARLKVEACGYE